MRFIETYLAECERIIARLDRAAIEGLVDRLAQTRDAGGRLFILGVGGSAANASHAVNDFRKLAGLEAYAPTDNVSEVTARTNDEGWDSVFAPWLRTSRLGLDDLVLVLSVGGGSLEQNVSPNLVSALRYAHEVGASIAGIVSRDGGFTAQIADVCVLIPVANPEHITPHAESFQAVIWHLLVSHPRLKSAATKWESLPCPLAGNAPCSSTAMACSTESSFATDVPIHPARSGNSSSPTKSSPPHRRSPTPASS